MWSLWSILFVCFYYSQKLAKKMECVLRRPPIRGWKKKLRVYTASDANRLKAFVFTSSSKMALFQWKRQFRWNSEKHRRYPFLANYCQKWDFKEQLQFIWDCRVIHDFLRCHQLINKSLKQGNTQEMWALHLHSQKSINCNLLGLGNTANFIMA